MADLNKIVEDLSSLSVIEAAELSKMLEEKWGVSAAAPVAAAVPAAGGNEAVAEEKSEFDLILAEIAVMPSYYVFYISSGLVHIWQNEHI